MCVNNPSVHSLVFGSRVPYKASLEMAWNQTNQWRYIIDTEQKPSDSYSPSFLQVQVRAFQHLDHKLVSFSNSFLNCEEKFHFTHNLITRTKCPTFTQTQTIYHLNCLHAIFYSRKWQRSFFNSEHNQYLSSIDRTYQFPI